ncbi:hypothetical protein ACIGXF_19115 [Streptomyces sp. NPDC053086]|uniref:hypothetical protein n=1 Tax=unclassified Streptomyces TaxID=2593676 RepID=UPI0037D78927
MTTVLEARYRAVLRLLPARPGPALTRRVGTAPTGCSRPALTGCTGCSRPALTGCTGVFPAGADRLHRGVPGRR